MKLNENNYRYVSVVLAVMLVLSMSVTFVGIGAAQESLEEGERYWMGQTIDYTVESGSTNAEVVTTDNSTFVTELTIADDDTVSIDSSGSEFSSGEYTLQYDNSSGTQQQVDFELATQTLDVEADDISVSNDDSTDSETEFVFDSNRATYDVNVSVNDLTNEEFAGLFTDESFTADDVEDGNLTITGVSSSVPVDFDGIDAGDYEFTFEVVDSGAEDTASVNVSEPGEATVDFTESSKTINRGDYADITLEFDETDTAEVVIGGEDVGYTLNFTVTDTEDNGEVTVRFDSYLAGQGGDTPVQVHEDSEGSVTVNEETTLSDRRLAAELYDMSVSPEGQSETDVGSLVIAERSSTGVSAQTLPGDTDVSELEDVENATPTSSVAQGDYLIFNVQMNGVYSFLDEDYDLGDENNTDGLYAELTEVGSSPNSADTVINMTDAEVYTDAEDGVFYVVFDTSVESFDFTTDSDYNLDVTLNENSDYIEDEDEVDTIETSTTLNERETEFVGFNNEDVLEYGASDENTVVAETNVADGTERTLTVRTTGENPAIDDYDVTAEDGEFTADVDMSEFNVGDEFTVQVRSETDRVDATIVEAGSSDYTINVASEDAGGNPIESTVTLDDEESTGTDASFNVASGTYTLTADAEGYDSQEQTVTVDEGNEQVTFVFGNEEDFSALDVNVVDENGESVEADVTIDSFTKTGSSVSYNLEDGEYTVNAEADGYQDGSETVTMNGESNSVTVTLSEDTSGSDNSTDNSTDSTNDSTPGFGAVVALIALLATMIGAFYRSD